MLPFVFFFLLFNCYISFSQDMAFITNQESDLLDVIDLKKMKKVDEIKVGKRPAGIIVDQFSKRVFVANPESNNVSIIDIDAKTNTIVKAGNSPISLALDNKTNLLFVSNWYDNKITILDDLSRSDLKNINILNKKFNCNFNFYQANIQNSVEVKKIF